MSGRRLEAGGAIDRNHPLRFTWEGRELTGFEGDTLASALLASGVDVVGRSPLQGRPRGIVAAGVDEPSAFVEVREPWFDAIVAATTVDLVDGLVARAVPGVGRLPAEPAAVPTRGAEHRYEHVEVLVVGGGVAGLRAATAAADGTDRVMVVDERGWWGGIVNSRDAVDDEPAWMWVERTMEDLRATPETTLLGRTTALGVYDDGWVVLHQREPGLDRIRHVRAGRVILAAGAHERPIAFADGDRPGVMLASAAALYADRFGVLAGERLVVCTTNDAGRGSAEALAAAGAEVRVVDVRDGWAVAAVHGERVEAVDLVGPSGAAETLPADLVAVSGGWNPVAQLYRAIGGGLRYDEALACFVPDGTGPQWLEVVGAAAGEGLPASAAFWFTPADDLSRHYVDLQRDQTVADVLAAVGRNLHSVEHVKRATYIGTAIDQGRTSGTLTAAIVNGAWGDGPGAQGPSNARPPYTPVSFAALAGPHRGRLLYPERHTSIHARHVERGAVFEHVGQWERPWYFSAEQGEELEAAVARECLAVRERVGVMDASTLGKIEVVGPDAPAFLDRMYTNRMSSLAVGGIRYGLMLGLDGMVFDDGVAMRLAEDRYLVTTTTGGAAQVLEHFEEWLQTEWLDLRVFCTSVTERWAVAAVNGPRARDVVETMGTDVDLGTDAFPHMTFRDGEVAGIPCRLARVSFSGELAYELHVAWWHGPALWSEVLDAGVANGIAPYGTEAMHVLRAEKGYVIVGQDTDGTVTPHDLGMSWIVNETKGDFVGRRSLRRADTVRPDRKQLVGLRSDELLPEGAQIVAEDIGRTPMPMIGHVTSSYRSAALGYPIALAMVVGGASMHGATVFAPLGARTVEATVVPPVFYDPEGARRDG